VRVIHSFLGLAGYYRRFIKDYGTIAEPLTRLLRKSGFRWTGEEETTFHNLQQALTSALVLQLPDFNREFMVECDASGAGIGAVLHQGGGPIAFFSRQMAPRHSKLAAYERELIGLVQAVRYWRAYLWGRAFTVKTDHYILKYLLDQRLATIPQHQWVSNLMGFDFRVQYKSGKSNMVADALSRRNTEEEGQLVALSTPSFKLFDDLHLKTEEAAALRQLKEEVQAGRRGDKWRLVDDLITVNGRVYVAVDSPSLSGLLEAVHGMGHEGTEKTLNRLRRDFFVPGARAAVKEHVRACVTCQRNKVEQLHPAGLLQPLEVPTTVWSHVAMDFVGGFPRVNGKSVILTVIDCFSKAVHFLPLGHPYTVTSVAKVFFEAIVRLHGLPESIISDRDPVFTSKFWIELCALSGVKLQLSLAFHPQTDGQSEAANKVITMYLRCLAGDRPRQWLKWLSWAEFCYNL
jgi:transposase InsO family protein